jgi:hypothetical protein
VQKFIYEWQPPRFGDGAGTLFFGSAALFAALILLLATQKRSETGVATKNGFGLRAGELLILLALFAMGCRSLRSVLWFALFLVPCASAVAALYLRTKQRSTVESRVPALQADTARAPRLLCAVLCGALILSLPPVKAHFVPAALRKRYAPSPRGEVPFVLDATTPVEAAEKVRDIPPRTLWNDMGQGAYLLWALPPQSALCDSRIELFSDAFWRDYLELCSGPPAAVRRLERQGVTVVLCDREAQAGLIARMNEASRWKRESFGNTVLFKRSE